MNNIRMNWNKIGSNGKQTLNKSNDKNTLKNIMPKMLSTTNVRKNSAHLWLPTLAQSKSHHWKE